MAIDPTRLTHPRIPDKLAVERLTAAIFDVEDELEAARNLEPDCSYGAVGAGRYTREGQRMRLLNEENPARSYLRCMTCNTWMIHHQAFFTRAVREAFEERHRHR